MSTRIKIAGVYQPKPGRKTGSVKAEDGTWYDVWPDKLVGLANGAEYDIETTSRVHNGRTYLTATKLTPVNCANGSGGGSNASAPKDSPRQYMMRAGNLLLMSHRAATAIFGVNYDHEDARTLFIQAAKAGCVAQMSDKPEGNEPEPEFETATAAGEPGLDL